MKWLRDVMQSVRDARDARRYRCLREFPELALYRRQDHDHVSLVKTDLMDERIDKVLANGTHR